ncbi:PucR family transcriptional regulator [Nocardioides sp.]|uniref:PucR family transcriptional regulator n=1 Tax=Nocardioides sp. TaxID=35761 RepID=UPI0039E69C88
MAISTSIDADGRDALSVADLARIAAPLELYPAWLPRVPGPVVEGCVIHDAGAAVPDRPGGVLLVVGTRPSSPDAEAAVREAGEHGYACAVVKARQERVDGLTAIAEDAGVALLVAGDETDWRDLDQLVGALVAAQDSRTPAYTQVRPGDLFALANAIAYHVGGATAIEDRNGQLFAYSTLPHQEIDEIRLRSITNRVTPTLVGDAERYLQARNATSPVRFERELPEQSSRLAMPVRAGEELLGLIWVLDGEPPLTAAAPQALESAARVAALHLLQLRQQENSQRWNRRELLASLLRGRVGAGAAAALLGLPVATPATVLAISPAAYGEDPALGVARTIDLVNLYCEAWHPQSLAAGVDEVIFALLPTPTGNAAGRSVSGFAHNIGDTVRRTNGVSLRIGIGPAVETLEGVPESGRLAALTLAAMRRGATGSTVASVAEVRSHVLLHGLATTGVLEPLPGDPVAEIVAHDQERNTTYAETLLAYLDAFGDAAAAARALNIHENTLRYRLRRAQELFPLDLADPDALLVTWLQLRMARIVAD